MSLRLECRRAASFPVFALLGLVTLAGCHDGRAHRTDAGDADAQPLGDAGLDGAAAPDASVDAASTDADAALDASPTDAGRPDAEGVDAVALEASAGDAGGIDGGVPATTHDFEYFHDGTDLRWVTAGATGTVASLPGATPRHAVFSEGTVALDGTLTERRSSVVYLANGALHRLDGRALGDAPPAPALVSSLGTIAEICSLESISNLVDRASSVVLFEWVPTGQTCAATPAASRNWSEVRLEGTANEAPTTTRFHPVPCVSELGEVEDVLVFGGAELRRIDTVDSPAPGDLLTTLSGRTLLDVFAIPMGGHRYLVLLYRDDTRFDLRAFDATTNTLGSSLGLFGDIVTVASETADDTYAYFAANPTINAPLGLYRVRIDGSAPAELLAGSAGAGWWFAGVTNGMVYVKAGSAVRGYPASVDFAAPGTPTTIATSVGAVVGFSSNRLFYQQGNFAAAVGLDGSNPTVFHAQAGETSTWVGCAAATANVLPRKNQRCERVLLLDPPSGNASLYSFDADTGGDATGAFFTHPSRAEVLVGTITEPYLNGAASQDERTRARARTSPLFGGTLITFMGVGQPFRYGIFYTASVLAPAPITTIDHATTGPDVVWLSRAY